MTGSKGRTEWSVFKLERRLKWSSTKVSVGPSLVCYIYTNEVDEYLSCNTLQFAGDTNIYSTVSSSEDIDRLRLTCVTLYHGQRNVVCFLT